MLVNKKAGEGPVVITINSPLVVGAPVKRGVGLGVSLCEALCVLYISNKDSHRCQLTPCIYDKTMNCTTPNTKYMSYESMELDF